MVTHRRATHPRPFELACRATCLCLLQIGAVRLAIEHVDFAGARKPGLMRKVRLSHGFLLVVVKCGWLVASRFCY
jgi:hypothetical protein